MPPAGRDLSGELIDDRYLVEYALGSGGMGSVWSVQHVESLKRFALKTLTIDLAARSEARERLLREARAGASLPTRHVVQVVDARHRGAGQHPEAHRKSAPRHSERLARVNFGKTEGIPAGPFDR